ncbi:hypothetical protein [Acinetobacter qingfengensis]|nr:hypothetical protein [Acinetobacter qingfengensis]
MKSNVQQPQSNMTSLLLSDLKLDKFSVLFFILGSILCAWFLHQFIF